jgi:hypothetical protein
MKTHFSERRTPKVERIFFFFNPRHPSNKPSIILLLILFLLLLTHCGKSQVVHKPYPVESPREETASNQRIIEVNGRRISPLVPTVFLLPGEPLAIGTRPVSPSLWQSRKASPNRTPSSGEKYQIVSNQPPGTRNQEGADPDGDFCSVFLNGQPLVRNKNPLFIGSAPEKPGLYNLEIAFPNKWRPTAFTPWMPDGEVPSVSVYSLLIIVLHPFSRLENGFIDQFPMGFYPDPQEPLLKTIPKELLPLYRPPNGFISVTPENQGTFVSRHFRLQDLDCHLKAPFPHYMALSPELLMKLETLTLKVQLLWGPEARLIIQSGFRTPWHNLAVSDALWSRHMYGDAADIVVARPSLNRNMADLNQDSRMDQGDAKILARLIEEVEKETGLVGGLGLYDWGENGRHGPFVHIDCRGVKARW